MRKPTILAAVAGVLSLSVGLVGCSSSSSGSATADNTYGLIKAGTITMCGDSPFPPFEEDDPSSPIGYSGFDVDIMSAIATNLGLKFAFVDQDFNIIQSGAALASKQCDIAGSALTITDERKQNLDFSDPYYDSLQSLLVPASSGITSLDQLAGKKIGVQSGTTGETYANANKPDGVTIVSFPSDAEEWSALQAGQVDALLQDLPVNQVHTQDDSSYVIADTYQTNEQYGFAVAKGQDAALLAAVNNQLTQIKSNGTYQTIYDKYFSDSPAPSDSPSA